MSSTDDFKKLDMIIFEFLCLIDSLDENNPMFNYNGKVLSLSNLFSDLLLILVLEKITKELHKCLNICAYPNEEKNDTCDAYKDHTLKRELPKNYKRFSILKKICYSRPSISKLLDFNSLEKLDADCQNIISPNSENNIRGYAAPNQVKKLSDKKNHSQVIKRGSIINSVGE